MSRLLAAKQFSSRLLQKSPLVQAVQQKSLAPYKAPMSRMLEPQSLMPMGRVRTVKPLDPVKLKQGFNLIERESLMRKAMERRDAIQRVMQKRKVDEMKKAWSGFLQRQF